MLQVDAFAWGWRSGKLTCFHCHGRTHVYALCRTFVVDKFVCFHWTKANSHRFRQIDRKACVLLQNADTFATAVRNDGCRFKLMYSSWRPVSSSRGCWWVACNSTEAEKLMHATLSGAE
jgi:hypothetical protein